MLQSYDQMMSLQGDFARNWINFANSE
jgi:hypothetical protein